MTLELESAPGAGSLRLALAYAPLKIPKAAQARLPRRCGIESWHPGAEHRQVSGAVTAGSVIPCVPMVARRPTNIA